MRRLASKTLEQNVNLPCDHTQKIYLRVVGVHGDLVLGSVTDETLIFEEGDIRGRGAVTLVVGDDLNSIVLPDTDAAEEDGQIGPTTGKTHTYE